MASRTFERPKEWTEITGLTFANDTQINIPVQDITEMVLWGKFSAGYAMQVHGVFPPTGTSSMRIDSGFYISNTANANLTLLLNGGGTSFRFYNPLFCGASATFDSIRLFVK